MWLHKTGTLRSALGEIHASKLQELSTWRIIGAPVFLVFDSQGARLKGLLALNGYGEIMQAVSNASGMVHNICLLWPQS